MKYKIASASKEYDIEIIESDHGLSVRVGKEPAVEILNVDFQTVGKGALYSLLVNRDSYRAIVSKNKNQHAVYMRGHRFEFTVEDERTHLMRSLIGNSKTKSDGEIKAPIPGLVAKVMVKEGDRIAAGQGILILEAMKMENEIKGPHEGVVKKMLVSAGKNVEKGQPLFVIEA